MAGARDYPIRIDVLLGYLSKLERPEAAVLAAVARALLDDEGRSRILLGWERLEDGTGLARPALHGGIVALLDRGLINVNKHMEFELMRKAGWGWAP